MPAVSRIGDLISTGHGCDSTAPIATGSSTVFANSIGVSRRGDAIVPHLIPNPSPLPACITHGANINSGSPTVFANGIPLARVGDSADAGSIIQGSPNVFAGP
jgi:uncharacterized Zn-binding protein involved in type VI secretion